jgi:hypothetical protein
VVCCVDAAHVWLMGGVMDNGVAAASNNSGRYYPDGPSMRATSQVGGPPICFHCRGL